MTLSPNSASQKEIAYAHFSCQQRKVETTAKIHDTTSFGNDGFSKKEYSLKSICGPNSSLDMSLSITCSCKIKLVIQEIQW
jgi:hypothetical protein